MRMRMWIRLAFVLTLLGLAVPATGSSAVGPPEIDPSQVVTAEACGECHASTYDVWKETKHATGFETLHRMQNAYEIAGRMGSRLIKRDSMCLDCHYTPIREEDELRAASGVSCESCHGAGKGYLDVHNDYGGKDVDHTTETPEHRTLRIEASRAAGMRRPSDLYALVSSCYGCHMVPNEKLVDVGRHSLGSSDFDLVSRIGEIRHNFLDSYLDGDGTVNADRSVAHQRRLVVLGRMLAVEHALRGVAAAEQDGVYFKSAERRVRRAATDLYQVARAANLDQADIAVTAALAIEASPGNSAPALAAARRVGELSREFLGAHDGTKLAAVDPLLQGGELPFVPLPRSEPDEPDEDQSAQIALAGTTASPDAGAPADPGLALASADDSASATLIPAQDAIEAEGERKSHLRPRSQHGTLEVAACQKCHGDQNAWWFGDRHYASIEPFLDRAAKNVQIATLYGISPTQMARGDSLCMDCHGTVAGRGSSREIEDGVSCQSCHGPAADYLEVHQAAEGEALTRDRPGYRQALQAGMKDLRDPAMAVKNCASCHYIVDRRLLSSGHPSGRDFDIAANMGKIQHWQSSTPQAGVLRAAWSAEVSARGAVPEVRLARLATPARTVRRGGSTQSSGAAGATGATQAASRPAAQGAASTDQDRIADDGASWADESVAARGGDEAQTRGDLPPRPEIADDADIDAVLRALQERLEQLYRAEGGTARAKEDKKNGGGGGGR